MKEIHFYFDFISPYAWLAFKALPQSLEGISHRVHYHPVVFGAMLKHHGQLGPAEMPGKRDWTYRQVMWLAKQQGTDLQMPASHPFNSLSLLRLAVAASDNGEPNRYVVESIFKHVWCTGLEASDAERLEALQLHLRSQAHLSLKDPHSVEVKQLLQQQTQQAIDLGLFGVLIFKVMRGLKVPIGWMLANCQWVFGEHLPPNNCRASTIRQLGSFGIRLRLSFPAVDQQRIGPSDGQKHQH